MAPHQFFTGVINGRDGNTSIPIVIGMACFGPLHPGQTGHPLGGQTLAVHRLFPPTTAADSPGNTGDGSTIDVDLSRDVGTNVEGSFNESGEFKALVWTLTALPGVDAVDVKIAGARVATLPGGHLELDEPLSRTSF